MSEIKDFYSNIGLSDDKKAELKSMLKAKYPQYADDDNGGTEVFKMENRNIEINRGQVKVRSKWMTGGAVAAAAALLLTIGAGAAKYAYKNNAPVASQEVADEITSEDETAMGGFKAEVTFSGTDMRVALPDYMVGSYVIEVWKSGIGIQSVQCVTYENEGPGKYIDVDMSGAKADAVKVLIGRTETGTICQYFAGDLVCDNDNISIDGAGSFDIRTLQEIISSNSSCEEGARLMAYVPYELEDPYTVEVIDGDDVLYKQSVSENDFHDGYRYISIPLYDKGRKQLTVRLTRDLTGGSVDYAVFDVDHDNKFAKTVKPLDEEGLRNINNAAKPDNSVLDDITFEMPDLIGKDIVQVSSEWRDKLGFISISEYDPDLEEGVIFEQSIKPGERVKPGENITVKVCKGSKPETVKVPDVVGLNRKDAEQLIKDSGLNAVIERLPNSSDDETVIDQSIDPDTTVEEGTEVTIYVSADDAEAVDMTLRVPMPEGLSGAYSVEVYKEGAAVYKQSISDGSEVAGSSIDIDIKGRNAETLTINITSNDTGKSVDYVTFNVDYENRTADVVGDFNKAGLVALSK